MATLLVAAVAHAEGPTREEYVGQVDPICKANTDANKPLLKKARKSAQQKKYKPAAADVMKAAKNFGTSLKKIEAVPQPAADAAQLQKWFGFLGIVKANLEKVSKALGEENKIKAQHEEIRVERSSNAANNVSFVFGFKYCHLKG
jgi:hypothetical protein